MIGHQAVTVVTTADGTVGAVLTLVMAPAVVLGTCVDRFDFHFIAANAIFHQLKSFMTRTRKGPVCIGAQLRTSAIVLSTLVNIFASPVIVRKCESNMTLADWLSIVVYACMFATSIISFTRICFKASLAVWLQGITGRTTTVEMSLVSIDAQLLTAAVVNLTTTRGSARSAVSLESISVRTFTAITATYINAPVLTAMCGLITLVYIVTMPLVVTESIAGRTLTRVRADAVITRVLASAVIYRTLVHIVLTARTLVATATVAQLSVVSETVSTVETRPGVARSV